MEQVLSLTSRSFSVDVKSLDALNGVAQKIATACTGGEVIYLSGELGAGKTTFVQYLASALGVTDVVNSPTFLVMKEYQIKNFELVHADCYRVTSFDDLASTGLSEKIGHGNNVCAIEWPERVAQLEEIPHIHLVFNSDDLTRTLTIEWHDRHDKYADFWSKITS